MQNFDERDFLSFLITKSSLDKSSVKSCRNNVNRLIRWLNGRELTKQVLEEYFIFLIESGKKNNTLNNYMFALRHLKNYCKDRGFNSDFFDGFKNFKKNQPEIIIFTLEEIEKILNTHLKYGNRNGNDCSFLDFTYLTLTTFLAQTGCRPEEAFCLKVKYFDLSAGSVQFVNTKTDKNRTNFVFGELLDKLRELAKNKSPEDFLFINSAGRKVNAEVYREDLARRAKLAGVTTKRVFPYNFRHSYITHQLEAGVAIQIVADLVGHADIQTTYKNYMHLADKTRREAAMRHPLIREQINPEQIVKQIKENIENFNLGNDKKRFDYLIQETEKGLSFRIEIK